jgi:hypothetical protein
LLSIGVGRATSLAADPLSGSLWVGQRNRLSKYAFDGSAIATLSLPCDSDEDEVFLAIDPDHGPWVGCGHLLLALETDGTERFRMVLAEEIEALAFNSRTRQGWIASEHEISVFRDDGAFMGSIASADLEDPHLTTDPSQGATWIASGTNLVKYNAALQETLRVRLAKEVRDLAADPRTGEVWVTQHFAVVKLSPDGQILRQVLPFAAHGKPTHLAVDPSTGTLWVGSNQLLALVSSEGAVSALALRLEHIRALAFFADLIPPRLDIQFPAADALLRTNAPTIRVRYSDEASGVDPASLQVIVDAQDVTSTCHAVDGGSDCVLSGVITLADGAHVVHARVADRGGNAAETSVSFALDTIPPVPPDADRIDIEPTADPSQWQVTGGPGAAEPGSTVGVRNTRTGALVLVTAGVDGSFTVTIAAEGGDVLAVTATDRAGNVSGATQKTVAAPPAQTQASGFIHGLVLHAQTAQPLAGVRVSVRGASGSVFTDSSGRFAFATPGTGQFTLFFERRGFVPARRDQYVLSQRHATVGEVHLMAFDGRTSLITSAAGGTITDSTGKVQAIFPPGAVARDTPVSATYFSTEAAFPLPMPEGTVFLAAVQMTPEHTSFAQPIRLRFANDLAFAPGTQIPFAFASHDTEDPHEGFYDPGTATVTADGAFIELQVTHFSCVSLGLAPPVGTNPGDECPDCPEPEEEEEVCQQNNATGLSSVCISNGNVELEQRLASVGALGGRDTLEFAYSSSTAHPQPVISARTKLSSLYFPTAPARQAWRVSLEGTEREASFLGSTQGTRLEYVWDGTSAAGLSVGTGAYHFKATSTGYFSGILSTAGTFGGLPTSPTSVQSPQLLPYGVSTGGYVMVHDQSRSPFGAGWGLAELERLYPQPDGTILWTDGAGDTRLMRPGTSASTAVFRGGQAGGLAKDAAGNPLRRGIYRQDHEDRARRDLLRLCQRRAHAEQPRFRSCRQSLRPQLHLPGRRAGADQPERPEHGRERLQQCVF